MIWCGCTPKTKKFDGERDEEGRPFSEKWEQDGNGEWCYGAISHLYIKKGRQDQKYRIKYDEGSSMQCTKEHIEAAPEGAESECSTEFQCSEGEERDRFDAEQEQEGESDNGLGEEEGPKMDSDVTDNSDSEVDETVRVGRVEYPIIPKRRRRSEEEENKTNDVDMVPVPVGVVPIKMGEQVVAGLVEDTRTEHHFDTHFKTNLFNDMTREVDIFNVLLPIGRDELLAIVRENAEEEYDKRQFFLWHIDCAIYGRDIWRGSV